VLDKNREISPLERERERETERRGEERVELYFGTGNLNLIR